MTPLPVQKKVIFAVIRHYREQKADVQLYLSVFHCSCYSFYKEAGNSERATWRLFMMELRRASKSFEITRFALFFLPLHVHPGLAILSRLLSISKTFLFLVLNLWLEEFLPERNLQSKLRFEQFLLSRYRFSSNPNSPFLHWTIMLLQIEFIDFLRVCSKSKNHVLRYNLFALFKNESIGACVFVVATSGLFEGEKTKVGLIWFHFLTHSKYPGRLLKKTSVRIDRSKSDAYCSEYKEISW